MVNEREYFTSYSSGLIGPRTLYKMHYLLADFSSENLQRLLEKETWNFIHAIDAEATAEELEVIREKIKTIISILNTRSDEFK